MERLTVYIDYDPTQIDVTDFEAVIDERLQSLYDENRHFRWTYDEPIDDFNREGAPGCYDEPYYSNECSSGDCVCDPDAYHLDHSSGWFFTVSTEFEDKEYGPYESYYKAFEGIEQTKDYTASFNDGIIREFTLPYRKDA